MSKSKVLIIDAQNWAHRAYHAMSRMQFNGRSVSAIWGFMNMLNSSINITKPKKVIACWDDGCNPHRVKLLPNYKKREPKIDFDRDDFKRQTDAIRMMLYYLGIPSLYRHKREADDFIYQQVKRHIRKGWRVEIASGDKDFRQLVTDKVFIRDDKHGLITPKNFKKKFKIEPYQYSDYLSLWGDNSDKIPGVRGFGEVTTLKFLESHITFKGYLNSGQKHSKHQELCDTYSINNRLINLEHFDQVYGPFKSTYFKGEKKPKRQINNFLKRCKRYGIKRFAQDSFIKLIP